MFFRILYSLCFALLLPVIFLRLLWRARRAPEYRKRWLERLGIFTAPEFNNKSIWVHAVSVGETMAALPLIEHLLKDYPDTPIVLTTTTPTGSARVKEQLGDRVFHVYAPYDLQLCVNAFLRRTKPGLAVVMETELWPNMFYCCRKQDIPVLVVNARLSEKSARGYGRILPITMEMFENINCIAVQNRIDAQRFTSLGLPESKQEVTGSVKLDVQVSPSQQQAAEALKKSFSGESGRTVLLAASTHAGEEEILLRISRELHNRGKNLLLVLVPRHPERFSEVLSLAVNEGFVTESRSQQQTPSHNCEVFIGDTMGELLLFCGASDVVFIGGSLVHHGGHNPIEAAVWGKPLVMGTSFFNFDFIVNAMKDVGALQICNNENELQEQCLKLLENPDQAAALGNNARNYVEENRGAVDRVMKIIGDHL
jgi:3-deoxy-D-manno-octulosonic-acid transferase